MSGLGGLRPRIGASLAGVRAVAANPALRRVVAAYAGFNFGEWATWIAILVYAFERGGAAETGVVALIQLIPATIVAPIAAGLGDRYPRERVLLLSYVCQALAMGATAVALWAHAPAPLVYLFAAATATSVTLTRPAHGAILPSLARTPSELTAANVASGTVQNLSILVAPAVAGVLLAAAGAQAVFALTAAVVIVSAVLVASVRTAGDKIRREGPSASESETDDRGAPDRRLTGGFGALVRLPGPRTVVLLIAAGGMVEGALDVFIVVLALDVLDVGETGVGILSSAVGVGGLLGAASAVTLVGRTRLAGPFATGLLLWGTPMAAVGLLPVPAVALLLFVVAGTGRSLMDVAGRTLLQRTTPDESLSRVFGVLEGLHMGMLGLGSIAVPALVALAGPRQALVLGGLWIPVVLLLTGRALRATDARAVVHVRELDLLSGIGIFAPLAPPTIEWLASQLIPIALPAGASIIRQGEAGDRYYVVDEGTVEVFVDDRFVRVEGPGESFGEIALVRNVPRTASVRARSDVRLLALERDVFLAAVAGHAPSRRAADSVATERLAPGSP